MLKGFSTEARTRRSQSAAIAGLCKAVLGAFLLAGICAPTSASAAQASCAALQAKYPDLKGKKLVNAINPHTPGYEAIDPKDPNKYVGFDIDLGEQIGECLGFTLSYKAVTFAALPTSALDPELVNEVLEVIRRLAVDDGLTMIISTHQIRFADEVADRVAFLSGGSIIEEGAAHERHPVTARFLSVMEAGKAPEPTA